MDDDAPPCRQHFVLVSWGRPRWMVPTRQLRRARPLGRTPRDKGPGRLFPTVSA